MSVTVAPPAARPGTESILAELELADLPAAELDELLARAALADRADDLLCADLASAARAAFVTPDGGTGFDRDGLWLHGLATACAAKSAAELTGRAPAMHAFAAGLLHDAGSFMLALHWPRSFARALRRAPTSDGFHLAEQAIFGVDHTLVGRRIARRHGWPAPVADSMWLHHHAPALLPTDLASRNTVVAVQVADVLARRERLGWSGDAEAVVRLTEPARVAGLTDEAIGEIAARLRTDVEQLVERGRHSRADRPAPDGGLEAIEHFSSAALTAADLSEVCRLAATALTHALSIRGAIVIVVAQGSPHLALGCSGPGGSSNERIRSADLPAPIDSVRLELSRAAASPAVPLPANLARTAASLQDAVGGDAAWLVPLRCGDGIAAGIALNAGDATMRSLLADNSRLSSWRAVIELAISRAARASHSSDDMESLVIGARTADEQRTATQTAAHMRVVDELASGAAHELNTPLAVIAGRLQQLMLNETDHDRRVVLEQIREQANRCSDIVTALAAVSEPEPSRPSALDLGLVIRDACRSAVASGRLSDQQLRLELSDGLPPLWADPRQTAEIVAELLANAIAATDSNTRLLTIKTALHSTDEQVVMTLADNGRGMTPDVLERAFDPFFSHQPAGRGRGLGLPRIKRLATLNGGTIRLFSGPGAGAEAELILPIAR